MNLKKSLQIFFQRLEKIPKKLLLGFSGGPDSKALLYLLLELREQFGFEVGLAHVDHRWRKESGLEAENLKSLANELELPFYLHTLDPFLLQGNLEDACREKRLKFFREICKRENYQALVLAHHSNDLAETVLKRFLEGAALSALSGIDEVKQMQDITILRPLLHVAKQELLNYLNEKGIDYFIDPSNQNPRFLRARMRGEIFPQLEGQFGKNVQAGICRIAKEAGELKTYLKEKLQPILEKSMSGPFGLHIDLTSIGSLFEVKWLLNELFSREKKSLSRPLLNTAASLILEKKANRKIELKGVTAILDRGHLFFLKQRLPLSQTYAGLKIGSFKLDGWQVEVKKARGGVPSALGLKNVWLGRCHAVVPLDDYWFGSPGPKLKSKLERFYSEAKTPAFLRNQVPILFNGKGVIQDFITGKHILKADDKEMAILVSLYRE